MFVINNITKTYFEIFFFLTMYKKVKIKRDESKVSENKYPEVNRRASLDEVEATVSIAQKEGLYRFDTREPTVKIFRK